MSDVLQQQTHNPQAPPPPNSGAGLSGGGVASADGRGSTPPSSLERLKRRMLGYRERQNKTLPKYENTMGAQSKQHKEDTRYSLNFIVKNVKLWSQAFLKKIKL